MEDLKLKALLEAIKESMGDKIGFSIFFTVDAKGDITHGSPLFRDPKNIEGMIKSMKAAARALDWMADDMYNRTSNRKN